LRSPDCNTTSDDTSAPGSIKTGKRAIAEKAQMNNLLPWIYANCRKLMTGEQGQDLAEYALLVALIALGSVSVIPYVTTALVSMFQTISNSV
jgi:Flp pilus assembly pilin Flp